MFNENGPYPLPFMAGVANTWLARRCTPHRRGLTIVAWPAQEKKVFRLKNILDQATLQKIRAHLLETSEWQDGRSTAGWKAREVKNNEQLPTEAQGLS
ncbi:hypothetical protein DUT91_25255, partial [Phyllobacterium salinisoli]